MKEKLTEEQKASRMATVIELVADYRLTVSEAEAYAQFTADDNFYHAVEEFRKKYLFK